MTRILTIIALLFATPMLAGCAAKKPELGTMERVKWQEERQKKLSQKHSQQKTLAAQSTFKAKAEIGIFDRQVKEAEATERRENHTIICKNYGFKPETEAFANCLMQQDIAAKQSAEMVRLRAQAASAQRKAEEAEKEASRARTQAIISNTIANQAKRNANTIPYGKDCPWLNGCKK